MSAERSPLPDASAPRILIAEHDPDDRLLAEEAFSKLGLGDGIRFVDDGDALLQYLRRTGRYAALGAAPRPELVLLDLNMPRNDGRVALHEIKSDAQLRDLPIVVFTTSQAEEDVVCTYDLGIAGFITKPDTFDGLVAVLGRHARDWLGMLERAATGEAGS